MSEMSMTENIDDTYDRFHDDVILAAALVVEICLDASYTPQAIIMREQAAMEEIRRAHTATAMSPANRRGGH